MCFHNKANTLKKQTQEKCIRFTFSIKVLKLSTVLQQGSVFSTVSTRSKVNMIKLEGHLMLGHVLRTLKRPTAAPPRHELQRQVRVGRHVRNKLRRMVREETLAAKIPARLRVLMNNLHGVQSCRKAPTKTPPKNREKKQSSNGGVVS